MKLRILCPQRFEIGDKITFAQFGGEHIPCRVVAISRLYITIEELDEYSRDIGTNVHLYPIFITKDKFYENRAARTKQTPIKRNSNIRKLRRRLNCNNYNITGQK